MKSGTRLFYGVDIGSTTAKIAILDSEFSLKYEKRTRTLGRPAEALLTLLDSIPDDLKPEKGKSPFVFTGTGGKVLADVLGGGFVNEIIAHTTAALFYFPTAQTVLDIGGQDTKLVILSSGASGKAQVEDFSLNSLCAAGTGAFLDQQAARLGMSIDEFSKQALKSETPARLAGRCTVFAKSDMIHLQQAAVPDHDIIAGLCLALARNIKATLAKGRTLNPPLVFQGGVAENLGVVRALKEVFALGDDGLVIPPHFRIMGAIGAVIKAVEEESFTQNFRGIEVLKEFIQNRSPSLKRLPKLRISNVNHALRPEKSLSSSDEDREYYLGIDVGSVSTKMVICNKKGEVVASYYGKTAGRPIEALKKGIKGLQNELGYEPNFAAVGTTGSGRYLAGDFIGADSVVNEITAQAKAAVAIDPDVDTIFEIGGQDSKYIRIEKGVVKDFMMNRACAAGTGSFLEEQAVKLKVPLEGFGSTALAADSPVKMGERCTVFMESDLVHYQQQGATTPDLVAGLCYAIAYNYLNKVVEGRPVGKKVFYQGATALNKGVVAAFETILGRPVIVPERCNLTGALGAALIAKESCKGQSKFRGFKAVDAEYKITTFECKGCPNLCSISKVSIDGRPPLFYGGRCEKYETSSHLTTSKKEKVFPNLVQERQDLIFSYALQDLEEASRFPKGPIGLPYALALQEWMPFFATFFKKLGYGPLISGPTNKQLIRRGAEAVVNEPCFPVKVAHGHVLELLQKGLKKIFVPALIDLPVRPPAPSGQVCPYVQSFPYTLQAGVDFADYGAEFLTLPLRMSMEENLNLPTLYKLSRMFQVGIKAVKEAWIAAWEAQRNFVRSCIERGQKALTGLKPNEKGIILVGRPYNVLDPGANLGVHNKLLKLGVLPIPIDHLDLDKQIKNIPNLETMYWRYGQRILAAGLEAASNPQLKAIYVTNFGCGPDSFLLHFFKDIHGDKPFLELEIDEHSADAGALTRIEAFLDTASHDDKTALTLSTSVKQPKPKEANKRDFVIYIPPMCDHSYIIQAAMNGCGCNAQVLPETDEQSLELGLKHTSGKECYPAILTTGDLVKMVNLPEFDPEKAAYFMPAGAGPCRFGQYPRLHRRVLDRLGFEKVPIITINQDVSIYSEADELGKAFPRLAWQGVVAVDLLEKMARAIRPYAKDREEVNHLYKEGLDMICKTIEARLDPSPVLKNYAESFLSLKHFDQKKPLIAVVGEIYTRVNAYANARLVNKLEELGAEVVLPSMAEWILYTNYTAIRRARRAREWKAYFRLVLENAIQIKDLRRLEKQIFPVPGGQEQPIKRVLKEAEPFVSSEYEGEAVLSTGKTVEYIENGVCGVINVMPLTCMPGTIANALITKVRKKVGSKPFLALACDGQQETGRHLRLEAFVHQAKEFM